MAEEAISSNKRIAKNTLMLYIRMLLSMVVSLYTSRVVLNTLGIEDYGIYGVVGSVVAMFGFLNASMSGATSRFLSYEMGRGDTQRIKDTFSSALLVHIGIALVVIFLAETVGLWFLVHKLVIPEERMFAARVVYQLSILSTLISITQVPYNAAIIAHEKMDIYAYVEILNVSLKLLIVYLLVIGNFDKLILYAILTLLISVLIACIYRVYCLKRFEECRFKLIFNKIILKNLLSFSSYNLYGNLGSVINLQGSNFVLNNLFGVILNSASSIATTVSNVVNNFSSNMLIAFRPRITKSYAQGDINSFQNLFIWAIKLILLVYALIAVPVFVEIDTILTLWLKIIPPYTSIFCRCILVNIYFETLRYIITMGIHAVGKVKVISTCTGSMLLLNPIVIYIILTKTSSPFYTYYSIILGNSILCVLDILLLKRYIPLLNLKNISISIIKSLGLSFTILILSLYWSTFFHPGIMRLFLTISFSIISFSIFFFWGDLNANQRRKIQSFCISKLKKHE